MKKFLIGKIHDEYKGFLVSFAIDKIVTLILDSKQNGSFELGLGIGLREGKEDGMFTHILDIYMVSEETKTKILVQSIPLTCKTNEAAKKEALLIVDAIGKIIKDELSKRNDGCNITTEKVYAGKPEVQKRKSNVISIHKNEDNDNKLH